ncbi:hypothetical protein CBS147353_9475 [Aspergillus niger]|nr:hypothetical protein CBS147353_9475 [Aspergillus niger]
MSNLFGKLTNQLSGQKTTAGSQQSSFSSIQHKLTDAVTGQKHPQDYQSQLRPDAGGHGGYQGGQESYRGGHGGYEGGGHGGYQGGQESYRGGHGGYEGGHRG